MPNRAHGTRPATRAAENAFRTGLSKKHMTRRPNSILTLCLVGCVLAGPVSAQVYRCTDGETTVFSDIPCSDDAELHDVRVGISVVSAAEDLDKVAERNKAFVDQRQEKLAERRERAAELGRQAERNRQRRAIAEEIRYRTIVSPVAASRLDSEQRQASDPRRTAQREDRSAGDEPARRRTLLSRSGGNQPRILR